MARLFSMSANFNQFDKYALKMLVAEQYYDTFVRQYLETLANMLIAKAQKRTPVDTGRLRRSYKIEKVVTKGNTTEITVYNDARDDGSSESYASFVEFGHFTRSRTRWIEGVRMLTVSTDELESDMQRVWNIQFKRWCRRMGIE